MPTPARRVLNPMQLDQTLGRGGRLIEVYMASQQQSSNTPVEAKDEWRTPLFVFNWANKIYEFDIDLAASKDNHLLAFHITQEVDALQASWIARGATGWCNPPYSDIDPWLSKAVDEANQGFTSVFLIPTPNGEDRYGAHVFDVASDVIFITGRLAFLRPDGTPVSGNTRGSCFVVYRGFDLGITRYRHVMRDAMKS